MLNLLIILESSSMSVLALTDTDVAVNSLDALSLPIEMRDSEIASIKTESTSDLKLDIQSLLDANQEYAKKNTATSENDITDSLSEATPWSTQILASLDGRDIFGDFLITSDTRLLSGPQWAKIKLDHRARTEQKVNGIRGTIAVNMATGTIISTLSGVIIDPTNIGIYPATPDDQIKADKFHAKKLKVKKSKKWIIPTDSSAEVFEFGIPGTHLIFSSPVTISIRTPMMSDGNVVDLAVLHAGNSIFNTSGLSLSSDTLCDTSGSASKPGSQAIVKNGRITFYTCGASSFTMNPTGGTAGSNDLRIIIGDCAQVQIYYNNQFQIYNTNPPAAGCAGTSPGSWAMLRIGGVTYGNGVDGVTATAWSTNTTTGSTSGNTYTATSTMTRVVGALTYTLIIDWSHTAPNKYLTWSYRVIVPATNAANVKFYMANDSSVAGADANDTGYYTMTGGQTIGVYDSVANVLSAYRYVSGPVWTSYETALWNTLTPKINTGVNFSNTGVATGDLAFGINWDFGTAPGTYSGSVEWRLLPYVSANVVDLIPGIAQPEGPLTTGYLSQIPITLTNAGNLTSSGVHTAVLTLPANISWPTSAFVDNGWSCGATAGTTVTCTKTTTIASLASDTFRIPVIPLPAAGGTSVTFNVSISNPGDSNTSNNTAFATNSVVSATIAYSPGGVTGANLWLKADGNKNCNTNWCTITTWNNSGAIAINAITGLGTVTYSTGVTMNYNPTVYFNNASLNVANNLWVTTAAVSIFTTSRIAAGGSFLIGPQAVVANSLNWSTTPTTDLLGLYPATNIYNGANGRATSTTDITSTSRAAGGTATNRTDGLQKLTNGAVVTAFAGTNIGIGRSNVTNSTLANVGEVILYPTEIIGANRNKIESYLAIKYGITLDQSIAQNYTLSNNAVAWNSASVGLYKNDIAGIARDDVSALSQVKSQSVNNAGDIIVSSVSAIGTNYQSFIWANDGTATGSWVATDTPSGYQRITREWQFQEKNGDLGNVKISYPVASVPAGFTGTLMMLIDSDGVFATGATTYTGTLNVGNWEFTVNVADMEYATFAKAVISDITPPVINSVSIASGALLPIGNFPLVITYSDTGSTINTSSFTGRIYAWDGVSAWGVTDLAPSYMTLSGAATTSTGRLTVAGLPFGKYRFDISVADTAGNIATQSITYYIDAIDWSISSDTYDIGNLVGGIQAFGTGEMTVTIRTVGAAFNLSMIANNTLTKWAETINYWNGTLGWGYDQWNGSAFLGTIISTGTAGTLANQTASINTNWLKNTYTYRIKYGSKISAEQAAGLYNGSMKMDLVASY
jgi:hypothetical protein